MGLIAKVLSYTRIADRFGAKVSDVKHDPGGGANETGEHFQAANQDAVPLPGDYLLTVSVQRTGGEVVVGFIDPKQEQTAQPGEYRAYARDADGAQVVQIHLKQDGTAVINNAEATVEMKPSGEVSTQNASGFYKLLASGVVDINGFTINTDGSAESPVSVTAPTVDGTSSVQAAGKELVDHTHAGSPTAPSGPVSPTGANQ
ncbi:MAG: hypothetical protein CMF72_22520 [Mameliella sp.]|nr:hypothetical protein [Mameliella sp.]